MGDPLEWSDLPQPDRGNYLGFLIGIAVSGVEIFEKAHRKAMSAINRFRGVFGGGMTRIFIVNVFIISILSYLWQFKPVPRSILIDLYRSVVTFIARMNLCKHQLPFSLRNKGFRLELTDISRTQLAAQFRIWRHLPRDPPRNRRVETI